MYSHPSVMQALDITAEQHLGICHLAAPAATELYCAAGTALGTPDLYAGIGCPVLPAAGTHLVFQDEGVHSLLGQHGCSFPFRLRGWG